MQLLASSVVIEEMSYEASVFENNQLKMFETETLFENNKERDATVADPSLQGKRFRIIAIVSRCRPVRSYLLTY